MNDPSFSAEQARVDGLEQALNARTRELVDARRENATLRALDKLGLTREKMLGDKLPHRVRNMIAVIRSMLRRTLEAGSSPEEFADHFGGRLDALARYQTVGTRGQRHSVELEDIVRDELLPTRRLDGPGCTISGPAVHLLPEAIEPITLAIHELATNAFKFGALTYDGGTLDIRWWMAADPDGAALHLRWTETGVPVIAAAPLPRGFGRQFIEEALPYQLGASTSFDLRPGGIACTIVLPMRHARLSAELASSDDHDAALSPELL